MKGAGCPLAVCIALCLVRPSHSVFLLRSAAGCALQFGLSEARNTTYQTAAECAAAAVSEAKCGIDFTRETDNVVPNLGIVMLERSPAGSLSGVCTCCIFPPFFFEASNYDVYQALPALPPSPPSPPLPPPLPPLPPPPSPPSIPSDGGGIMVGAVAAAGAAGGLLLVMVAVGWLRRRAVAQKKLSTTKSFTAISAAAGSAESASISEQPGPGMVGPAMAAEAKGLPESSSASSSRKLRERPPPGYESYEPETTPGAQGMARSYPTPIVQATVVTEGAALVGDPVLTSSSTTTVDANRGLHCSPSGSVPMGQPVLAESLPMGQVAPTCASAPLDTTGDGVVDSVALDTTGDGALDTVLPMMCSTTPRSSAALV